MQAFEFKTKISNGIIKIPEIENLKSNQEVKVILLVENIEVSASQKKLLSEYAKKQNEQFEQIDKIEASDRNTKKEEAIRLLQKWTSDESGYDESVWDDLKKQIEENRLSERKRFHD